MAQRVAHSLTLLWFEEVRSCRGTQFVPAVVDAFFVAVRKRPEDFGFAETHPLAG